METNDTVEAPGTATDGMLSRILSELLFLKRETLELRKLPQLVARLSEENAELKKIVLRLSLSQDPARGRAPTKQQLGTRNRSSSAQRQQTSPVVTGVRLAGMRRNEVTPRGTPRKSLLKTVNERPTLARHRAPQRILHVEKNPREPARSTGLPKTNVRLYNQKISVVLRDTDVDAKGLYEYLASKNLKVSSVTALKQKFRHYGSFVLDCNEGIVDQLFDISL